MKKVAIIGTQGIPAHYGGFETLTENLVLRRTENVEYGVYCSSKDLPTFAEHINGCKLQYIKLHSNGMQSIPYDICSMWKARKGYDTLLILGVSGCIFMPILKRITKSKIVVNIDGLEHKRKKWGEFARWFLRFSEKMAVKYADTIIADNQSIADYVTETYGKKSVLIAYGGDNTIEPVSERRQNEIIRNFGVPSDYALSICRIEPENNVELILEAFSERKDKNLVFLGNWNINRYSQSLRKKYSNYKNIRLLDANFQKDVLYTLRTNCKYYIHGHTAGGTNPSLVEIMFFGKPIFAYDVNYNHHTTGNCAAYFSTKEDLKKQLDLHDSDGIKLKSIAEEKYQWKDIVEQYESIL